MRLLPLAAAAAAALVALAMACSKDEGSTFCTSASCGADASLGDGNVPGFGADHGAPESLAIAPSNPTLEITNLQNLANQQLTAQLTFADGTNATIPASWTIDRIDIASIGAGTGLVQPTGAVFGRATVTAQAQGLKATTTVTVTAKATVNLDNVPPADATKLAGATAIDPAITALDYPYDGTVFPRGLLAPELMWSLGSPGDEYELHLVAPYLDLAVLMTADPPSRFAMPQALWDTFVTSAAGSDAKVTLDRLSGGVAYVSAHETWHIADANLRGLVYFWNVSQGQLLKADLTIGQVSPVFSPGSSQFICGSAPCGSGNPRALNSGLLPDAGPPWEDNGVGNRCVACHSVSKDGSKLVGVFAKGGSSGPLGVIDLSTTLVDTIGDYTASGMLTAITPDGTLAVMNTNDKHMHLVDGTSGMTVTGGLDALTNVCDPSFSADGKHLVMAGNCTGGTNFALEFSRSDLVLYDFDEPSQTFSNPRTVLASGGAGSALAFPSLTPDSKWIVFQGGDYSRAKYGTNQHGSDDLYVVAAQPGSTPIALDGANGAGILPTDSLHLDYAPTVSPIVAGGYYWVVFTSPRDYGNRMVSPEQAPPNDATYANHKQLWVTAVDTTIGSSDPSHPAFWLPGQDATTANMFGYWTLAPCKPTLNDAGPSTCQTGFECCSGFCRDTAQGFVCTNNPGGCSQIGEKCTTNSDCCGAGPSLGCLAGICQTTTK
jgi:hypothetical protein